MGQQVERIGIVGAGRAGGALARALAAAGWPVVAVASRTPAHAERLAAALPQAAALPSAQAVVDAADLAFLTVPDAAIGPVAASVAWRPGQAVAHTSGVDTLESLAPARQAGALVGSLHPLQTFGPAPAADPLAPFAGITCALEADATLLPRLEAIVAALGARPVRLPAGAKPLYHAAAVVASNYLVTLLHLAAELWGAFGVDESTAIDALRPLVWGAVDNVAAHGPGQALTGPIARGDAATVEQHLAAIARARPEALDAYRTLARATLALARTEGSLTPEAAGALARLLADGAGAD
ncbi:MAG TPA: Rossmann-like and DUF2520 domain-containing protein [Chloroflexota bacterium]|nr:Rossmann-like and DUF2520 domain-containing protein [Chloroflexota bacterium]